MCFRIPYVAMRIFFCEILIYTSWTSPLNFHTADPEPQMFFKYDSTSRDKENPVPGFGNDFFIEHPQASKIAGIFHVSVLMKSAVLWL